MISTLRAAVAPRHPKPVIGLTGAPGAGKSTAASLLAEAGCRVIDADALGHAALLDPALVAAVARRFGPGVLDAAGRVERRLLGQRVFGDPAARADLEALVHPWIHARRAEARAAAFADPACRAVVEDCALLFEVGLDRECDTTLFVDAPADLRLRRVAARGWDAAELARREAAQWPLDKKRASSDHVLLNDGTTEALAHAVRRFLNHI